MGSIKISAIFMALLFFAGCRAEKNTGGEATGDTPVVDVNKALKEERIVLSELFSGVKTIILETREDIMLGYINSVQVCNGRIFVLDRSRNVGVYVFDSEGKFIRRYGKRGAGPGEYVRVSDFTLDAGNDAVYLLDCDANRILKYRISTGEFENAIHLGGGNEKSFHIQYGSGKLYTDADYAAGTPNRCMLREIDPQSGKRKNCLLDPSRYNSGWRGALQRGNESFFYSRNQQEFKFVHYFMNTVVAFHNDRITPAMILKDDSWISAPHIDRMQQDSEKTGVPVSLAGIMDKDIAFNINSYTEWDGFICFQYQKKMDASMVLYNTETKSARMTSLFINDLVYSAPMLVNGFGCSDSSGVYEVVNTNAMARFVERSASDDFLKPDLDKIGELKTLTDDSNPVIFHYRF